MDNKFGLEAIRKNMDELEAMIDQYQLSNVLGTLSEICYLKAEDHVQTNWQNRPLARAWKEAARILDKADNYVTKRGL